MPSKKKNQFFYLKNCCPVCIAQPIEYLPECKYGEKNPAEYKLKLGYETIWLCKPHMIELISQLKQFERNELMNEKEDGL